MLFDPVLPDGSVQSRPMPRSWAAFAAVALGLAAARWIEGPGSALWFAAAAGCAAVAAAFRGRTCRVALFAAAACLAGGWFNLRLREPSADSVLRLIPAGETIVRVEGVVLDTPRRAQREPDPLAPPLPEPGWRLRVSLTGAEVGGAMRPVSGRVRVRAMGGDAAAVRAGDRVRLDGLLAPIAPPLNPGEPDRRLWAAQEGYIGDLRSATVTRLEADTATWPAVRSTVLAARAALADRARMLLLGDPRGVGLSDEERDGRALLGALILGEEDAGARETRSAFARLGLAHVLSISGFHLAVLAAVALAALRAAGDLGWREPVLVALLVAAYLAILPVNAPVWRSGLMVLALLAAEAAGRRYDRLALLGWIAVALVIWRPMDLWSLGFQLSFGLVALLIWMGDGVHQRIWGWRIRGGIMPRPTWHGWVLERCKQAVSANVLCCLAATPLVMYHTGLVSPLAVVTGLVIVPIVSVLLILGYAAIGIGLLVPALSGPANEMLERLAGLTASLVRGIDDAPVTSLYAPPVPLVWAVLATGAVLYLLTRAHRKSRWLWAAGGVLAVWVVVQGWIGGATGRGVALRIDTLAVGDGTCHIVRCGREAVLWDCGSLTPGVGRQIVPGAARALGVWRVPTVVVTHANLDHFNGLLDAAPMLGVERVIVGEGFIEQSKSRPYGSEAYVLGQLRSRGIDVHVVAAGDRLMLGDAVVEFLSPPRDAIWPVQNDRSLVARISVDGRPAALLCGDVQDAAMDWLRSQYPGLHAPVVEVPHHGSARERAVRFVEEAQPRVVLQSTGPARAGDARWAAVRAQVDWRCTAVDGASWAEVMVDGSVRARSFRRGRE